MNAPAGRFIELPESSDCVDQARKMLLRFIDGPEPSLRNLMYGFHAGDDVKSAQGLQDASSRKYVGEIVHRWKTWGDDDPVEVYLGIRLQSRRVLEGIGFRGDPSTLYLFDSGDAIGKLVEKRLPPDKRWWRRVLGGERLWHLYLHDEFIGVLQLEYQLRHYMVVHLQLHNGVRWPICLRRVWFRQETRFVIPPDAPHVPTAELEALYFTVSAIMRIHVCH